MVNPFVIELSAAEAVSIYGLPRTITSMPISILACAGALALHQRRQHGCGLCANAGAWGAHGGQRGAAFGRSR